MNINELIAIVKDKIESEVKVESIKIEDKTFLHKSHKGYQAGKFHIKIFLESKELKDMNKIESNKKIFEILNYEIKNFIHSIQILIR